MAGTTRLALFLMGTVLPIPGLALTPAQIAGIPVTYSITDLDAVNFYDSRTFVALNANGQLTGNYLPPDALVPHAFLATADTISDLGVLPALGTSSSTLGIGINASGQVAGNAVGSQTQHSFLTVGTTLTDLGFLPGGAPYSAAAGVNASGQVTGYSFTTNSGNYAADFALRHAYVYANGALTDLGSLQAGGYSYGTAINDSGQIVGGASVPVPAGAPPGNYEHAFYYANGVMTEYPLPAKLPVLSTYVTAINNAGVAVGSMVASTPGAADPTMMVAVKYSGGLIYVLGNLGNPAPGGTTAIAINDSGIIVGTSDGAAFISNSVNTLANLNFYVDPTDPLAPSVNLTSGLSINNAGVILAQATINSATHYLLLTLQPLIFVPSKTGFADTVVGTTSAPLSVSVINLGATAVTLANFSVTGNFAQSNNCGGSLTGQTECTINVTFNPASVGSLIGGIALTSDGAEHLYQLQGRGGFTVSLKNAGPASPTVSQPFTLVWSSVAGAVCNAAGGGQGDGWNGAVLDSSGSTAVTETSTGIVDYALYCILNGVTEQTSIDMSIAAAPAPAPTATPAPTHSGGGEVDPVTLLILSALAMRSFVNGRQTRRSARRCVKWRPHGDSNPGSHRERVVS
jgi:probable HAF family extracellular repeat protein